MGFDVIPITLPNSVYFGVIVKAKWQQNHPEKGGRSYEDQYTTDYSDHWSLFGPDDANQ
jgi:hypothetical protein